MKKFFCCGVISTACVAVVFFTDQWLGVDFVGVGCSAEAIHRIIGAIVGVVIFQMDSWFE